MKWSGAVDGKTVKKCNFSISLIPVVFAIAGCYSLEAQSVLDTFSSMRVDGGGSNLWSGWSSTTFATNCTTGNNQLTCVPSSVNPPNGLTYWFQSCDSGSNGCYNDPGSYLKAFIQSGAWSANSNRFRFSYMCDGNVPASPGGGKNVEIGTYTRNINDPNPSQSGQGFHYYHSTNANAYANTWIAVELNNAPDGETGWLSSYNFPTDPEWVTPGSVGYPVHYFDGMTHFYWKGYLDPGHYYNSTCHFANFTFATVTNSPDGWVRDITATYNGSAYEMTWNAPKNPPINLFTYDVKYSTTSMRANGWSSGTSGGTATSDPSGYDGTRYTSPAVSRAPTMYIAIRPRMNVASVSQTAPIIVTPWTDHGLQTGDQVSLSGLSGGSWASANGTQTVTVNPRPVFRFGNSSLTSIIVASNVATVTTVSPHGLQPGQLVNVIWSANQDLDNYGTPYVIRTVPSATSFTLSAPIATGTYTSANSSSMLVVAKDSLSLNGSNGLSYGTWTPNTGVLTATSNTSNFTEIAVPITPGGSAVSSTVPCDLNLDGVVNILDVQLSVNAALGLSACSADLNGDGICNVVDIQRVIAAAQGGVCVVGA